MLDHYNAGDWAANRTLITGDLIQDDSAAAYQRFRDMLLPLNMRMHCVPGNHDVRDLMLPVCSRPPFSYCAMEEVGEWMLLGIDSCIHGEAGGKVADSELERLTKTINNSAAKHILVFLHHPPVPLGSAWLDTVGLKNGDQLLDTLQESGRVRMLLFGHVHQPYDAEHSGIRVVGTPSTCRQFQPGSDDFAVDDQPPAYRHIELFQGGTIETRLIWVKA